METEKNKQVMCLIAVLNVFVEIFKILFGLAEWLMVGVLKVIRAIFRFIFFVWLFS